MKIQDSAEKINQAIIRVLGIDVFKTRLSRKSKYEDARIIYFYLLRSEGYVLEDISATLDMHHSSVIHSIKQFEAFLKIDPGFKRKYQLIVNDLSGLASIQRHAVKAHLRSWYLI